ncbi:MAG: peptidoglycan DD-metalloendopeptidase family protein [Candidatus Accumulibacter sp.]|jgi:septal ring factor EnvC (AmiA/AmiB activator)|nr:peptidoglycan DD-metalloendopeptidase family protein [Accumulibacter sp.]
MNIFLSAAISASLTLRRIVSGAVLSCAVLFIACPAFSGEDGTASPTRAAAQEKKSDLLELRGQIEALRKQMTEAEGQRASAVDQVKDVEREISATQRELHTLSGQKNKTRASLKELGKQAQTLTERLDQLRLQLEDLVYRSYLQGQPDALRLLLNGQDPNRMTRDLYYLGAIARARRQLLDETETLLERQRTLSENTRERAEELASIESRQKEQHAHLLAQRKQRRETLSKISSRIAQQRKEIGNLQRDEKDLTRLIARLDRIVAAQAAARKARAARAAVPETRSPGVDNEHTPEAVPSVDFAALKGRLRLPVRGKVTNRYGAARQEGSTWKGLFIRAARGSEVKTIAGGRVVFADWMRGFGNLLIVDHGGNYLSVYGYNDAVLKQTGDDVRGGDSIATAGNSGGNPESGLYFELRYQGRPVDPMKWVSLK